MADVVLDENDLIESLERVLGFNRKSAFGKNKMTHFSVLPRFELTQRQIMPCHQQQIATLRFARLFVTTMKEKDTSYHTVGVVSRRDVLMKMSSRRKTERFYFVSIPRF